MPLALTSLSNWTQRNENILCLCFLSAFAWFLLPLWLCSVHLCHCQCERWLGTSLFLHEHHINFQKMCQLMCDMHWKHKSEIISDLSLEMNWFQSRFLTQLHVYFPPQDHKNPQELCPHLCKFPSDGPTNSLLIPHSHEVSCQFIIHPSICPSVRPSVQAPGSHFPWDGVGGSCSDVEEQQFFRLSTAETGGSSHCPPVSSLSCFGVCPQLTVTDEGRKLRKHTSTSPTSLQTLHSPLIYEQDPKIFAGAETPVFSTLSTMTLWLFVCRKKTKKAHIGVDVKPDFTGWDLWGAAAVVFMGV